MAFTDRPDGAPLDFEIFSGGSRTSDGFLGTFLRDLEIRLFEAIEGGNLRRSAYRAVTDVDATIAITDSIVDVDTSTAAVTLSLPAVADVPAGWEFRVRDVGGSVSTNNITVDPDGSETIDGSATLAISTNNQIRVIYSTGTAWLSAVI